MPRCLLLLKLSRHEISIYIDNVAHNQSDLPSWFATLKTAFPEQLKGISKQKTLYKQRYQTSNNIHKFFRTLFSVEHLSCKSYVQTVISWVVKKERRTKMFSPLYGVESIYYYTTDWHKILRTKKLIIILYSLQVTYMVASIFTNVSDYTVNG